MQTKLTTPFDYDIYVAKDGLIGQMNDKEEWNGLVDELQRGVSEMSMRFRCT